MPLSDLSIRQAKRRAKEYKLSDGDGLYLLITPSGGKLWRFKYYLHGKEKKLAIGSYPEISLSDARKKRDEARALVAADADPSIEKQRAKIRARADAANTFEKAAQLYNEKRQKDGLSKGTFEQNIYYISQLPRNFRQMPIKIITPQDVREAVRVIENKGTQETARRTLQLAGRIFCFAVAELGLPADPTRDLKGVVKAAEKKHFGAIIETDKVGPLLRAIDSFDGYYITKLALQLAPHVFVRPGELRHAEWHEIDFNKAIWFIESQKMKMKRRHNVPLSRQALALLRQLHKITGAEGYIFPSIRTGRRPMSENTLNAALRRLGYTGDEMTAHGFRAMASSLLNESGKWNPDAIEKALAHKGEDEIRATYNRSAYWDERVKMAQWWSDHLDMLRDGATIVNFPKRTA